MSGITGIIHFDGEPVEREQVEKMTTAMAHRGPDRIHHWVSGSVALGHCMLCTTPESLEDTQPLTNEDESLVLVMDGRVDNWDELRKELLGRGAKLRNRSDSELVLRAYEIWGDDCPDRIIGEFTFFIWDARQNRLFAARDAAGTRHIYFYARSRCFFFSSEIKGIVALERFPLRLNESRLFDYLVAQFDRNDEVGTFYQDINRLPAGHAMQVTEQGVRTWRYWNPGNLPAMHFSSLDECAEAFLEQLRVAVKCRLRSIGPVCAMLSGGLDSSSIVGLIRKEFQNELTQPLRTVSLIREDRENCLDWQHIREILKGGGIEPTIITSAVVDEVYQAFLDNTRAFDEPFAFTHGFTYSIIYEAARKNGCRVVFDGMAGDLHFYGPDRTLNAIFQEKLFKTIPAMLAACHRHGIDNGIKKLARKSLSSMAPGSVRNLYRKCRVKNASSDDDVKLLNEQIVKQFLENKHTESARVTGHSKIENDQELHSRYFTSGLLSFAHEVYGQIAFSDGVEPRSPYSDRRMIEFAIRMPLESKLFSPWYKHLLRKSMEGILPEKVRWRTDLGAGHPGWKFYERLISGMVDQSDLWNMQTVTTNLSQWIDNGVLHRKSCEYRQRNDYSIGFNLFRLVILNQWLTVVP